MSTLQRTILFGSAITLLLIHSSIALSQTASTGAISGTLTDESRAVILGVEIQVTNLATGEIRKTLSDEVGRYFVGLLAPGRYSVQAIQPGFKLVTRTPINVNVSETHTVDIALEVAEGKEEVVVESDAAIMQVENPTLGRVVDSRGVTQLPLATRNFTQLTALSPGTTTTLPDTAKLGPGSINIFVNGASHISNNFQINGIDANNPTTNDSSGGADGGVHGVATPSVDTIEQFKVQTSLYDASYGRSPGANINVVTKSGTREFHGSLYEFLRNDVLNANNFFFNSTGTKRPVLKQNQFGGTFGGPIPVGGEPRAFFFGSYEGTRQRNGASLRGSVVQMVLPPIPADRSRQSLGAVFGGKSGAFGGLAVARDGSNINPVALALLNLRGPNSGFLIPSLGVMQSSWSLLDWNRETPDD